MNNCLIDALKNHFKDLPHVPFDGLGIGTTQLHFQLLASSLLRFCHPAFAPQLAIGEVEEKVGVLLHGKVVMDRIVLAELEGLEAVDDNVGYRGRGFHELRVQQEAVPSEAGYMSVDRLWCDLQIPGNLPVAHASDGFHKDLLVKLGHLLPVCCAERLTTEGSLAV